jgi:hypothetical protein
MEELIDEYTNKIYHLNKDVNYEDIEKFIQDFAKDLLSLPDHRPYMNLKDWTTECLWYLGDKAQLDFHNNGWENYRLQKSMDKRHKFPNENGEYQVILHNKIKNVNWLNNQFTFFDSDITHYKKINLPKDLI